MTTIRLYRNRRREIPGTHEYVLVELGGGDLNRTLAANLRDDAFSRRLLERFQDEHGARMLTYNVTTERRNTIHRQFEKAIDAERQRLTEGHEPSQTVQDLAQRAAQAHMAQAVAFQRYDESNDRLVALAAAIATSQGKVDRSFHPDQDLAACPRERYRAHLVTKAELARAFADDTATAAEETYSRAFTNGYREPALSA